MKVMIDTNIIISAALSPNGNAAKAFMKAVLPPYEPVVCDYIVDELHRKFQEKFPRKTTELEAFLYNAILIEINRGTHSRHAPLSLISLAGRVLPFPILRRRPSASLRPLHSRPAAPPWRGPNSW